MIIDTNICFECGGTEEIHQHHVIPKSLGGTKTIPLCNMCHGRAHGKLNGIGVHKNPNDWKRLIKIGREKWIANGGVQGRPAGSNESNEKFINKPSNRRIKELLEQGYSVRNVARMVGGASTRTVVKVRKMIDMTNVTPMKRTKPVSSDIDPIPHTFF